MARSAAPFTQFVKLLQRTAEAPACLAGRCRIRTRCSSPRSRSCGRTTSEASGCESPPFPAKTRALIAAKRDAAMPSCPAEFDSARRVRFRPARLPAAERENRGRRVWRCLPSRVEPMAAPARYSPRSSFQKRRATIVSGGIPQCILGDARGAGADGARHPHVHGPDLRQAEQQVRPSSRAPARPSTAIGCGRHPERRVRRGRPATAEGRAVARRAQGSWRALLTAEGAARLCCRYVRLRLVGGAGDRRVA